MNCYAYLKFQTNKQTNKQHTHFFLISFIYSCTVPIVRTQQHSPANKAPRIAKYGDGVTNNLMISRPKWRRLPPPRTTRGRNGPQRRFARPRKRHTCTRISSTSTIANRNPCRGKFALFVVGLPLVSCAILSCSDGVMVDRDLYFIYLFFHIHLLIHPSQP